MSRTIKPHTRSRTLLIGTVLLLATGCGTSSSGDGGTSPRADAGVDGGSGGGTDAGAGGGRDAGSDGGSAGGGTCNLGSGCNSLAQLGQPVTVEKVASDGPAPGGGTFVAGTYILTAAGYYECGGRPGGPMCNGASTPTGDTMQATAVVTVSGNTASMQLVLTKDSCVDEHVNIDLTPSGNGLAFAATQTCPANGDGLAALVLPNCPMCTPDWSFEVGSGSFTLYNAMSNTEDAWVSFSRCDPTSPAGTCVVPCQNGAGCHTCPNAGSMPCGCTPYGQCVDDECASGCPNSNASVCNPETLQCVQCITSGPLGSHNAKCPTGTPICENFACVQCLSNSDCTGAEVCQQNACTAGAGTADAGTADAGTADAGTADAGTADAGTADAGDGG